MLSLLASGAGPKGLIEMADSQPPANKTSLLVTLVPTPMGYAAEKSTT